MPITDAAKLPEPKTTVELLNVTDDNTWVFGVESNMCEFFDAHVINPAWTRDEGGRFVEYESVKNYQGQNLDDPASGFQHADFWWEKARAIIEQELERPQ